MEALKNYIHPMMLVCVAVISYAFFKINHFTFDKDNYEKMSLPALQRGFTESVLSKDYTREGEQSIPRPMNNVGLNYNSGF